MGIQEKLLKFKVHILFPLILLGLLFSLVIFAPSFFTLLAYFWPLFLSTALFLVAVVFFGKPSTSDASHVEHHKAAAEDLLNYVAGQDQTVQHQHPETEGEDEGEPVAGSSS
ncbi:uncharacterized protein LOC123201920 [Mangifera indica]|uniref:uncharacterized protein LOC123201920 n=1 Tax=Mangifera indica TaxID=29780 RepID=UPI001CFB16C6|nr:uncharacterized protein LOC123201920 [Mangifera indica]